MVHRVALQRDQPQPKGKPFAAHNCRNRNCYNPAHLYWATAAENMADKIRDETHSRGSRHPRSKLSEDQARRVKFGTECHLELSREFGVSYQSISQIRQGKTWAWLLP